MDIFNLTFSQDASAEALMLRKALQKAKDRKEAIPVAPPARMPSQISHQSSFKSECSEISAIGELTEEDIKKLTDMGCEGSDDFTDQYGEFFEFSNAVSEVKHSNTASKGDVTRLFSSEDFEGDECINRGDEHGNAQSDNDSVLVTDSNPDRLSPLRSDRNPLNEAQMGEFDPDFAVDSSALSPAEARKYFGDPAKRRFQERCQWIRKQHMMTHSSLSPSTKDRNRKLKQKTHLSSSPPAKVMGGKAHAISSSLSPVKATKPLQGVLTSSLARTPSTPSRGTNREMLLTSSSLSPLKSPSHRRHAPGSHSTSLRCSLSEQSTSPLSAAQAEGTMLMFDNRDDPDAEWYTNSDSLSLAEQFSPLASPQQTNAMPHADPSDNNSFLHEARDDVSSLLSIEPTSSATPIDNLLHQNIPDASRRVFETLRAMTPDLHKPPGRGSGLTEPSSPRSAYIAGCVAHKLNPRASLVVRKKMTRELELQHYGMVRRVMYFCIRESWLYFPFCISQCVVVLVFTF